MEEFRNEATSNRSKNYAKRLWKDEEDKLLYRLVEENGPRNWNWIAQRMQGRSGKSCRLRWVNHLAPHVKRTPLNFYEELKLLNLHRIHGNKWSTIAFHFPGRTDNQLKNHFHGIMGRYKRLFSDFVGVNKDQLHDFNLKVMNSFPDALVEQLRILRLPNSSQMANILHGMQSYEMADCYRYIIGKVAQYVREMKSLPPQAEGHNMQEKNVNQERRTGKPMTPVDLLSESEPQPNMVFMQGQEEILVQKKPPRFIDFLGVGNVE